MKKNDADEDYKRSKFLVTAMILQIVVFLILLFVYLAWLQA